ncbi:hypothetical protein BJ138DRAFT_1154864 [Hygrophoropsis aurantiaca]|uniref:Uncharacterized protein n=1 Tax=Hygrophoropsis aurantiaca TaxID=72124 RepID=A0ACB8A8A1_9AGAM|nr:hypothetical protein BJ138DRAFT_1154864 [Hygrophoropsis aurantiaca]
MSVHVDLREYQQLWQDRDFFRHKVIELGHRNIPNDILERSIASLVAERALRSPPVNSVPPINPGHWNPSPWNPPQNTNGAWPDLFSRNADAWNHHCNEPLQAPHRCNCHVDWNCPFHNGNLALDQRRPNNFVNWLDLDGGVRADPDRQRGAALPNTPHNHGWADLPHHHGRAFWTTPPTPTTPALPRRQPDISTWNFPSGTLTWSPHPQPQPGVPPHQFFGTNRLLGPAQHVERATAPVDPWSAARVTGGWPLPGTCPQWTAETFPALQHTQNTSVLLAPWLIPNPVNANLPQINWDIGRHPSSARRITHSHVNLDINTVFREKAMEPAVRKLQIVCDAGHMSQQWGTINVERATYITIRDVFESIHQFFQSPLTWPELQYIEGLSPGNRRLLDQAFHRRCYENNSGLSAHQAREGFRRVDCLGDKRIFWGLWITFNPDSTWYLNLGLISSPQG